MSYDWIPFLGGVLVFLFSPALDGFWKPQAQDYFKDQGKYANLGPKAFASVLAWIADLAQTVPSASLVLVGATLLIHRVPFAVAGSAFIATTLVVVVATLRVGRDKEPQTYETRYWPRDRETRTLLRLLRRSPLQWLLLALNVAGLAAVLLLPLHVPDDATTPARTPPTATPRVTSAPRATPSQSRRPGPVPTAPLQTTTPPHR